MSIATEEQQVVEKVQNKLYIGGEWRDATGGGTLEVIDPATEEPICEVADGTPEDAMAALDAAVETQQEWGNSAPNDRAGVLWKAFELLTERADELATLMTLEMGKPVAESKAEIVYAADFFRWFSGEALRIEGNYKQFANGTARVLVMKQPVGATLMITPWNFPMAMGTRKLGPGDRGRLRERREAGAADAAVHAGAGPDPRGGRAAGRCREHPHDLVVRIDHRPADRGRAAAEAVVHRLDRGGPEADRGIGEERAEGLDGAGRQRAVPGLRRRRPRRGGRGRAAGEDAEHRRGVHLGQPLPRGGAGPRGVHEAACGQDGLAEDRARHGGGREGRPADRRAVPREGVGADRGCALKGATKVVGGEIPDGRGYFIEPTVLGDVPEDARVFHEEIFGPVAPVGGFDSEEEAIAKANDTEYGLVAYVFTRDIKRAIRVCEGLETGMVGLNQGMVSNAGAPFGGVKQSGIGREGGHEGLEEFLETKYVAVNL